MDTINLRNFKDFMMLYNETTEKCFTKCVNNFNSRQLDSDELHCTESCAGKHINFFNKIMSCYLDAQQDIMTKRIAEAQLDAAKAAQAPAEVASPPPSD